MHKRPALRISLLVLAAVLSTGIAVIGLQTTQIRNAGGPTGFNLQSIALMMIGVTCLIGVTVSAVAREWLRQRVWLGRAFVCVALALPATDFYALLPDPGAARALRAQAFISLIVGSLIALAIATAWIKQFNRTSLD